MSIGFVNFLCCFVLVVFGVVVWISICYNICGIDFDEVFCGLVFKESYREDVNCGI